MFMTEGKDLCSSIIAKIIDDVPLGKMSNIDLFNTVVSIRNYIDMAVEKLPDEQKGICLDFPSFEDYCAYFLPIKDIPELAAIGEIELVLPSSVTEKTTAVIQRKVDVESLVLSAMHRVKAVYDYQFAQAKNNNG